MYNIRLVSKFDNGFFQERSRGVKIDVILKGEMLIMFPTHITHTQLKQVKTLRKKKKKYWLVDLTYLIIELWKVRKEKKHMYINARTCTSLQTTQGKWGAFNHLRLKPWKWYLYRYSNVFLLCTIYDLLANLTTILSRTFSGCQNRCHT